MTALPRRMYRDPQEQLLEREAETCRGCKHRQPWKGADYCENPLTKHLLAEQRCEKYEEDE